MYDTGLKIAFWNAPPWTIAHTPELLTTFNSTPEPLHPRILEYRPEKKFIRVVCQVEFDGDVRFRVAT